MDNELLTSLEAQGLPRGWTRWAIKKIESNGDDPRTHDLAAIYDKTLSNSENKEILENQLMDLEPDLINIRLQKEAFEEAQRRAIDENAIVAPPDVFEWNDKQMGQARIVLPEENKTINAYKNTYKTTNQNDEIEHYLRVFFQYVKNIIKRMHIKFTINPKGVFFTISI